MKEFISKAATLVEALPYIQRFRSQIFVVKYGGSFMDSPDPEERHRVARDVVFLEAVGINPVVVHGGGKTITRALQDAGVKSEFIRGYRVTDEESAKVVDRVLSREINAEIVKAIQDFGGKARGFVFMSDVPGLLRDPKDEKTLLRHLAVIEVPKLQKSGVIAEGMVPKVDSAIAAIESGVEKVQFVDGRISHSVLLEIFTDAGVGTEVVL